MKTFSQGTEMWRRITEGMTIIAYNPPFTATVEGEVVEPGKAVKLPAADRARMGRAKPGVHTKPDHV